MRILYFDLDTLRPDHLGCYGYHRNTSPNIDRIASEGVRFDNYYASDAPCLPSRSALYTGRFGIHTGVVNHGGEASEPFNEGRPRGFKQSAAFTSWMSMLRKAGYRTVSVSPFAERHSAWWFYNGFVEMINTKKSGNEMAHEIQPKAVDWLDRNAEEDNWFLQINYWDPHGYYRTPDEYGNPFEDDPPPTWLTEEMIEEHYNSYGPHSAHDPLGYGGETPNLSRVPREIKTFADYKKWIDGYDVGIKYMDDHIGELLDLLEKKGVLEDTIVIVSSDHGENQGELNVYGDHQTADQITSRIPMIIRWPGMKQGTVDKELHYNVDLPPTMANLLGQESPPVWDGKSFAKTLTEGVPEGRDYLVVSQCAWSCQRAVRFGPWILIRTYHDGLKNFPPIMLFNIEEDPHETNNVAEENPDVVNQGLAILHEWHTEMMLSSDENVDPMWTVIREGGPLHTRASVERYTKRLRETGREQHAEKIEKQHAQFKWPKK